jgi:hypothetical protein
MSAWVDQVSHQLSGVGVYIGGFLLRDVIQGAVLPNHTGGAILLLLYHYTNGGIAK